LVRAFNEPVESAQSASCEYASKWIDADGLNADEGPGCESDLLRVAPIAVLWTSRGVVTAAVDHQTHGL
jgi:hypothetical protein